VAFKCLHACPRPNGLAGELHFLLAGEPLPHNGAGRPDGPTWNAFAGICDFGDFRRVPEVLIADG
jgi:hypothetical protein